LEAEIPEDVKRAALELVHGRGGWHTAEEMLVVCRAIMAERERAAQLADIYYLQEHGGWWIYSKDLSTAIRKGA
jgi:hypothetical protein